MTSSPEIPTTAFKEWAVVCRALAAGRQDVILRKGGIAEPDGRFRPAFARFLLLPTFVHQGPEAIVEEARGLLENIDSDKPPPGWVEFTHMASVQNVIKVLKLSDLDGFRGRHIWADAVIAERFHRWKDELHVLEVKVAPLAAPFVVPWHDDYGGCKSWVSLRPDAAS